MYFFGVLQTNSASLRAYKGFVSELSSKTKAENFINPVNDLFDDQIVGFVHQAGPTHNHFITLSF